MIALSSAIGAHNLANEPVIQPIGRPLARGVGGGNGNHKSHPAEVTRTGTAPAAAPHGIEHPVEVSRTVIGAAAALPG